MNFQEQQDRARRETGRLVIYFIGAVLGLILSLYLVATLVFTGGSMEGPIWWNPELLLFVAAATGLVVGLGSGFKIMQLSSGGGAAVAESLGGRRIDPRSTNLEERRILNVVEEMAIASGVPVPPVYLLEEAGINAFAAGKSPEEAVIGVTRGCIQAMNRDQLQGVMAHEFSHILNGDMMINLRLMGILHGILLISIIGQMMLRGGVYSSAFSGGRRDRGGGNKGAVILMALAMLVLGWLGVIFGNLIKAAVSRQREYLADASAVQFTRNPDGIAGALKVIAAHHKGSDLDNPHASEASHMLFSRGGHSLFTDLFATHPPIEERIRRIDPHWDGQLPGRRKPKRRGPPPLPPQFDK